MGSEFVHSLQLGYDSHDQECGNNQSSGLEMNWMVLYHEDHSKGIEHFSVKKIK
jgi:hypothetical protein